MPGMRQAQDDKKQILHMPGMRQARDDKTSRAKGRIRMTGHILYRFVILTQLA